MKVKCPFCKKEVDTRAKRCPHCTTELTDTPEWEKVKKSASKSYLIGVILVLGTFFFLYFKSH